MTGVHTIPFASIVTPATNRHRVLVTGSLACAAGVLANVVPACVVLTLLKTPPGSSIRPMAEVTMVFLGILGGVAVGAPLAIICLIASRRWWIGWLLGLVGLAISLSPGFANHYLMEWVVAKQGLTMEP